jgi:hypothetical protein
MTRTPRPQSIFARARRWRARSKDTDRAFERLSQPPHQSAAACRGGRGRLSRFRRKSIRQTRSRHGSSSFFVRRNAVLNRVCVEWKVSRGVGDNLTIRFAITTCAAGDLSGISRSGDVDPRTPRSGVRDAVQALRAPRMPLSRISLRPRSLKIGFDAPASPELALPHTFRADMTPRDDGREGFIDAHHRASEAARSGRPCLRLESLSPCRSCSV